MRKLRFDSSLSLSLLLVGALTGACSSKMGQYGGTEVFLRAKRVLGSNTGDMNPPISAAGNIDAKAAISGGAALPDAGVFVPQKEGSSEVSAAGSEDASKKDSDESESENEMHSEHVATSKEASKSSEVDISIEKSLLGGCLAKINKAHQFQSYKVVAVEGKNGNKSIVYEDSESGEGSLILLRVRENNLNKAQIKMLNPKSTYCVDIEAKNMNKFTFTMACEAKVGFVKLENKNDNKLSTVVKQAVCD